MLARIWRFLCVYCDSREIAESKESLVEAIKGIRFDFNELKREIGAVWRR